MSMAIKKIKKVVRVLRENGFDGLMAAIRRQAEHKNIDRQYALWINEFDTLNDAKREKLKQAALSFQHKPKISIVMPVYNVDERFLREAIDSIRSQIYQNWELCIADDYSPKPHVRRVINEYLAKDDRIKAVFRETNGHISAASNSALALATGEFTALMDHDDLLTEDALYQVVRALNHHPDTLFIYSDEDKIDADGRRFRPTFKPDLSPELFASLNMVTHLCVFKTEILREIDGFRVGFEGSQDYDLSLRYIDHIDASKVVHIPHVLYHWRSIPGSVALDLDEKSYAHDNARRALSEHFLRVKVNARSVRGVSQTHRTVYELPDPRPSVTVIVDGLLDTKAEHIKTAARSYGNAIIVESGNTGSRFERLNKLAFAAETDLLVFINAGVRSVSDGWIEEMAARAMIEAVGAVGVKLNDTNGRVVNAGFIFSDRGILVDACRGRRRNDYGYFMQLAVDRNVSAISADCMAIRRDIFIAAGGFDAAAFPDHFADADLCQRLIEQGLRIVWTPWAEVTAVEKSSESGISPELTELNLRWKQTFANDPYLNPNLAVNFEAGDKNFVASPPRINRFKV